MAPTRSVQEAHLQGVYSLLDDLQAGFVLLDPEGQIVHASYWVRRLLPRRAVRGTGEALLGAALYAELCAPVMAGRSKGQRWRETELRGREKGVQVQVSVRSTQVVFEDGRCGALLSLHDVSSEVGLHKQNRALLEQQKKINANLRLEIARQLREHEDDISQLNEILQIAPTIFASFMAEASHTIEITEALRQGDSDSEQLQASLRELHTLKGNARSLGLNFIGGRAHGVEDLLQQAEKEPDAERRARLLEQLPELLEDLQRAVSRASFVRSRLSNSIAEPVVDIQQQRHMAEALAALQEALAALPADSPGRAPLERAEALVSTAAELELQGLFEFLKASASRVAQSLATECPVMDTSGGEIRVGPELYALLSNALPHIVRNAVTHGIESAEERLERGKAPIGHIHIEATCEADTLRIDIADDGRGLRTERLERIAGERGLPRPTTPEALAALLFAPGVSTAEEVDHNQGRGMGSTAAYESVKELGGDIQVESSPEQGTRFIVILPMPSAASAGA